MSTTAEQVMLAVAVNHISFEAARAGKHFGIVHDLVTALREAGFEITKVGRTDWRGVANDMIGIHALHTRREYYETAQKADDAAQSAPADTSGGTE